MFANQVSKDLEVNVFQNVQLIKFGKIIIVFVFQDLHGSKVLVELVLKIHNLLKIKLPVFAIQLIKFIQ